MLPKRETCDSTDEDLFQAGDENGFFLRTNIVWVLIKIKKKVKQNRRNRCSYSILDFGQCPGTGMGSASAELCATHTHPEYGTSRQRRGATDTS